MKHKSNRMGRAKNIIEEGVFLKLWNEIQERRPAINGGYGALDLILNNRPVTTQPPGMSMRARLRLINRWSKRDAYVAASIIQWLGTKEGKLFIDEAERRIVVEKRKASEEFNRVFNLGLPPKSKRSMASILGRSI